MKVLDSARVVFFRAVIALIVATPFVATIVGGLASDLAHADGAPPNENPLTASARVELSSPDAKDGIVIIDLDLADPYKAYADRFKLAVESPAGAELSNVELSPLIQFMDSFTGKMKSGIKKHGKMTARLNFQSADPAKIKLKLTYQACTTAHCLFPKNIALEPTVVHGIARASDGSDNTRPSVDAPMVPEPEPKAAAQPKAAGGSSDFERAMNGGIFSAILFMVIAGFLTSLTPCIYPMIPITLAILGASDRRSGVRAAGAPPRSQFKSFLLSIFYVLGIATTYSLLGVTAASTGALFGSALSNVWIVSGLGIVFVLMGLSMYGLFEIQAPAFVRDRLGQGKSEAGFISSYATGLAAGVVASPCIGPVLVSVLAYIAQTQNRLLGFILLFSFAMGMGVLFVALGTSSSLLHRVPKAGPWMEIIKFIFGTTMIGMALYYVAPVYPEWVLRGLIGLAVVLIASAFGIFAAADTGLGRVRKGASIATFCVGIVLILASALEKSGVKLAALQQASNGEIKGVNKLPWKEFSDDALGAAIREGKPVIIDFWADWCGACKELERDTFVDPRIQALSSQFALFKIDATEDSDRLKELKVRFNVLGLPTMILYGKKSRKIQSELTVTGFENADQFLEKMNKALSL